MLSPARRSRHHDRVRARQRRERLAQPAQRDGRAAAERIERIQHDDVERPRQPPVLEAVVEQKHVRLEPLFDQPARARAIRADPHRPDSRPHVRSAPRRRSAPPAPARQAR